MLVKTFRLVAALAFLISVQADCPQGFYCALKKMGGEWCTGHEQCFSGKCITGVGCAVKENVEDSGGCLYDDECKPGLSCEDGKCLDTRKPQNPEVIVEEAESEEEPDEEPEEPIENERPETSFSSSTDVSKDEEEAEAFAADKDGLSAGLQGFLAAIGLVVLVLGMYGFKNILSKDTTEVVDDEEKKNDDATDVAPSEVGEAREEP